MTTQETERTHYAEIVLAVLQKPADLATLMPADKDLIIHTLPPVVFVK